MLIIKENFFLEIFLFVNRLMSSANKKELLKILLVHILFFEIGTCFIGYKFIYYIGFFITLLYFK